MSNDRNKWATRDVRRILSNLIYAGLGPYPPIVTDDHWARVQSRLVSSHGSRRTLCMISCTLRDSFDGRMQCIEREAWIDESVAAIKQIGAEAFFRCLLLELREELG